MMFETPTGQAGRANEAVVAVPERPSVPSKTSASLLAFSASLLLVLVYALRGGSYDVIAFQEHGLVIWWMLALGFMFGLLPRARPPRTVLALLGALAGYALWTGLSLLWSQSAERTTEELARTVDYAGIVALLGLTLSRSNWRSAAAGLATGALVVCALAVGGRVAPSIFPSDELDRLLHIDRLSYPFGYWNAVGAWAAMSIAIGLGWSSHEPRRVIRALMLAAVPVAGAAAYLTYSRAAVAGSALGVLMVLATSRNRLSALVHVTAAVVGTGAVILAIRGAPQVAHATGTHGGWRVLMVVLVAMLGCAGAAMLTRKLKLDGMRLPGSQSRPAALVAVVVLVGAGGAFGPHLVSRGWHSFTHEGTAASSSDNATGRLTSLSSTRYPLWKSAVKAFDAHPSDGTGAGTFEFWWNRHATLQLFVHDTHNIWLQDMSELGLPGLILIIGVAVSALVLAAQARRRARRSASAGATTAFLAVFVVYLLHASVDWMWQSTAVTVLALAGVAVIGSRGASGRPRFGVAIRVSVALLALAAGAVQLPGLISTVAIHRSQAAERAGDANAALAWTRTAVNAEPWSASAYEQRALVYEAAGQYGHAADDLRRSASHEPVNYARWLVLARVEAEQGQLRSATHDLARAHQLSPRSAFFGVMHLLQRISGAGPAKP